MAIGVGKPDNYIGGTNWTFSELAHAGAANTDSTIRNWASGQNAMQSGVSVFAEVMPGKHEADWSGWKKTLESANKQAMLNKASGTLLEKYQEFRSEIAPNSKLSVPVLLAFFARLIEQSDTDHMSIKELSHHELVRRLQQAEDERTQLERDLARKEAAVGAKQVENFAPEIAARFKNASRLTEAGGYRAAKQELQATIDSIDPSGEAETRLALKADALFRLATVSLEEGEEHLLRSRIAIANSFAAREQKNLARNAFESAKILGLRALHSSLVGDHETTDKIRRRMSRILKGLLVVAENVGFAFHQIDDFKTKFYVEPDIYTFNTLLNLAKDLKAGEAIFERINAAPDVELTETTTTTFARLATTIEEVERVIEMTADTGKCGPSFWSSLMPVLCNAFSGNDLLGFVFVRIRGIGGTFFIGGLDAAISWYRTQKDYKSALRVAVAFPHFESARKLFRQEHEISITTLSDHYNLEPHHATYALAIAYLEVGNKSLFNRWSLEAKKLNKDNKIRLAHLDKMRLRVDNQTSSDG